MDFNEFSLLEDGEYEFITYMDEKFVGVPYSENATGLENCYVIPLSKMKEFNETKLPIVERVAVGLLIPINPDVIDECKKIR